MLDFESSAEALKDLRSVYKVHQLFFSPGLILTSKIGSIPWKPDLDRALKVERFCREKPDPPPPPPVSCRFPAHLTVLIYRLFAAKTSDFESSVKVMFSRDWPNFWGQDQAWREQQLVNFIHWSEVFKCLGQSSQSWDFWLFTAWTA